MRYAIGTAGLLGALTLLGACTTSAVTADTGTPTARPTAPSTPSSAAPSTSQPRSRHVATAHRTTGQSLPLSYPTGDADQVVTVVATSHSSTTAMLQAWHRDSGGWQRSGPAVAAWLGSAGIGHTSEQSTATPEGSFGLTQAFGRDPDPGTRLPYRRTTPADWWISQPGPLYNTEQHCSSGCAFDQGDPNEHLYDETPYYDYAVVIDYNTDPVVPGAGSAFFVHVSVGEPTQGCVSIAREHLVRLLRWLDPRQHPRILLGVG